MSAAEQFASFFFRRETCVHEGIPGRGGDWCNGEDEHDAIVCKKRMAITEGYTTTRQHFSAQALFDKVHPRLLRRGNMSVSRAKIEIESVEEALTCWSAQSIQTYPKAEMPKLPAHALPRGTRRISSSASWLLLA